MKTAIAAIALAAIALSLAVYSHLPAAIPTHWNAKGEIDHYSSRALGAFALPGVMVLMTALFAVLPAISPRGYEIDGESRPYRAIFAAVLLLLFGVHVQVLLAALKIGGPAPVLVPLLLGAAFVIIGAFLPQMRRNFFVGIRTPWTLADEGVWVRTHKFGGPLFVVCGIAMAAIGPFLRGRGPAILIAVLVGTAALVSVVYSYIIYRRV